MKKLSLLLALALLLGSMGVVHADAADPKAEITTRAGYQALAQAEPDAFGAYEETQVVRVIREFRPNTWYPEGENEEDNIWTRYYKDTLNVEYQTTTMCESGRRDEQLDLAIAANELPDVFDVTPQQLYRLAKAGQIQPLDAAYEKYASANLHSLLEIEDKIYFKQAVVDGKLYGLPATDDFYGGTPLFYVRQDWMEKLGLEVPKTLAEFEAVFEAFVKNDPDGNGVDDTYAFNLHQNFGQALDAIAHAFGQYPNEWILKDGKLVYSDIQPEFKEVIKQMQLYYQKGYIDREFATKSESKVGEDIAAGKIGIEFGPFWQPVADPQNAKKNNPDAEWSVYAQPLNQEGKIHSKAVMSCYRYQVVREGYEAPEVGIKGQNLWYELWQGSLSDTYHTLNQTEYHESQEDFKYYPPFWFDPPKKNYTVNINLRDVYDNGKDASELKFAEARKHYNNIMAYQNGEAGDSLYGWAEGLIRLHSFRVIEKEYEPNGYVFSEYRGPVTSVIANKQPLADKCRIEELTKLIMGADVDANWDAYVDNWLKSGGEDLTNEVNAWYAEQNG